jgi:hypothetical protein
MSETPLLWPGDKKLLKESQGGIFFTAILLGVSFAVRMTFRAAVVTRHGRNNFTKIHHLYISALRNLEGEGERTTSLWS